MSQNQTISVVGLGYIGLPTAAMFASRRIKVVGVDVNPDVVKAINAGKIHIVEPDLDIAVHSVVSEGWLRATTVPEPADSFLIAVPTPFRGPGRQPDLSYVEAAARTIAPVLARGNLVVLESTSPVGATERMAEILAEARPDLTFPATHGADSDIRIAHCPERVLPGRVMQELITNDRLIGGLTQKCSETAAQLYKLFVTGSCIFTDARTAELAKLTENSFRDVNIAFANELSLVCDGLGIDVWELIRLANRHPRVNILQPGPGVGGHCIAVDPWFIVSSAPDTARLIRIAREVNDAKPEWVLDKVRNAVAATLLDQPGRTAGDLTVAVYGLAFKPDIDDLRESPALSIASELARMLPRPIAVVEPNIAALPKTLENARLASAEECAGADIHVMLVDHSGFKSMPKPQGVVIDTRGVWAGR
ncbi:UDP-N-acetyl-D-mannosamine dehydrogenase [Shinella pollutisoli]|uniref:UDP-N-acetyl-D-mannosamine dehydrogenase n=1 Tax=Shinella pollutisoli TaxID=2250594 RepID=A0ABV7DH93_9HYPH|nr:UDP-N-acetyl-D-mannosamine dehydrogenase [Shinella pollutisoli]